MKTQGKVWIIYDSETKSQTKPMSVIQAQVTLLELVSSAPERFFIWTPGWNEWVSVQDFLKSDQSYFAINQPPKPHEPPPKHETITITKTEGSVLTATGEIIYTQVVVDEGPIKDEPSGEYWKQDFNGDQLDLKKIELPKKHKPESTKKKSEPSHAPGKLSAVHQDPRMPASGSDSHSDRRKDPRHNFKIEVVLVSKVKSFRTYSRNISVSGTMLEDEIPREFLNQPFDLIIKNPFEPDPKKSRLLFKAKIVGDLADPRRLMFMEQDSAMTLKLDALLRAYVAYQNRVKKSAV